MSDPVTLCDLACRQSRCPDDLACQSLGNSRTTSVPHRFNRVVTPCQQLFIASSRRVGAGSHALSEEIDPVVPIPRNRKVEKSILVRRSPRLEPRRHDENGFTKNFISHELEHYEQTTDSPV